MFPHFRSMTDQAELEEERRLAYVGITRAQQRLYLTHAWSRSLFGQTNFNPPSRFLGEIPGHLLDVQESEARLERTSRYGSRRQQGAGASAGAGGYTVVGLPGQSGEVQVERGWRAPQVAGREQARDPRDQGGRHRAARALGRGRGRAGQRRAPTTPRRRSASARRGRSGCCWRTPRSRRSAELSPPRRGGGSSRSPRARVPRHREPVVAEPDVAGLLDVQREQVEVRLLGRPVDPAPDRVAERLRGPRGRARPPRGRRASRRRPRPSGRASRCGRRRADRAAGRAPSRLCHIMPTNSRPAAKSHSHGLIRGEPSRPDRAEHHELVLAEPLLGHRGDPRRRLRERIPAHRRSDASAREPVEHVAGDAVDDRVAEAVGPVGHADVDDGAAAGRREHAEHGVVVGELGRRARASRRRTPPSTVCSSSPGSCA